MQGRASATAAVGLVGGVAIVAAAAVVFLAPRATPEESNQPGVETEVPTQLVDGTPPSQPPADVRSLVEEPAIMVDRRDELPDGMTCAMGHRWEDEPEVEAVFVTPTSLQGTLVGEASFPGGREEQPEAEPMRVRCTGRPVGGGWAESGGGMHSQADPGPPGTSSSHGSSCCHDGHGTANAEVSVAGDIAWVLQDRGPYWLVYPVEGLDTVTVAWPFPQSAFGGSSPPPSRVRLVDADGDVVVERLVGR